MANNLMIFEVISNDLAKRLTEQIMSVPQNEAINMLVNSIGGNPDAGWTILAAMADRKEVNMTVMGNASSMMFYMLLFASKVIAYDTISITIHRAAAINESQLTADQLAGVKAQNDKLRSKLESRVSENKFIEVTGKSFDDIFDMNNRIDVNITAEQGKELGLIDEIKKLDVRKMAEITAEYHNNIAAMATIETQTQKSKSMGMFDFLGSKESVLLAKIGDTQCVYAKAEKGAKIKAVGDANIEVTGSFDAGNKKITVVKNEITAVEEINVEAVKIGLLEAKIIELTNIVEASQKKPDAVDNTEKVAKLEANIEALQKVIVDAKLMVSTPLIPKGEFHEADPNIELTAQERLAIAQSEAYEASVKKREES